MPIQTLRCPVHGTHDELVKMDRSDCPLHCAATVCDLPATAESVWRACGLPLERIIATTASIFPGASSWQK